MSEIKFAFRYLKVSLSISERIKIRDFVVLSSIRGKSQKNVKRNDKSSLLLEKFRIDRYIELYRWNKIEK